MGWDKCLPLCLRVRLIDSALQSQDQTPKARSRRHNKNRVGPVYSCPSLEPRAPFPERPSEGWVRKGSRTWGHVRLPSVFPSSLPTLCPFEGSPVGTPDTPLVSSKSLSAHGSLHIIGGVWSCSWGFTSRISDAHSHSGPRVERRRRPEPRETRSLGVRQNLGPDSIYGDTGFPDLEPTYSLTRPSCHLTILCDLVVGG